MESPEAKVFAGSIGELVDRSHWMEGAISGRGTRKAETGLDPGPFLAELFARGALAGVGMFAVSVDEFDGVVGTSAAT